MKFFHFPLAPVKIGVTSDKSVRLRLRSFETLAKVIYFFLQLEALNQTVGFCKEITAFGLCHD